MEFESEVWGPHYWFFLHTIAHSYPNKPNSITKKKYYDFINNMPLFIPNEKIGDNFAELLNKYPVSPYLDNRDSFKRWVHFIHNKINVSLGKEEISFFESEDLYKSFYKPKHIYISEKMRIHKSYIHIILIFIFLFFIYVYY